MLLGDLIHDPPLIRISLGVKLPYIRGGAGNIVPRIVEHKQLHGHPALDGQFAVEGLNALEGLGFIRFLRACGMQDVIPGIVMEDLMVGMRALPLEVVVEGPAALVLRINADGSALVHRLALLDRQIRAVPVKGQFFRRDEWPGCRMVKSEEKALVRHRTPGRGAELLQVLGGHIQHDQAVQA